MSRLSYDELLRLYADERDPVWRVFARIDASPYDDPPMAWGAYAYGFKLAADVVARECYKAPSGNYHPPLLFLYRHYVELSLKELWLRLLERQLIESKFRNTHDIVKLLVGIKPALAQLGYHFESDAFLANVENTIRELDRLDANSEQSRYPERGERLHGFEVDLPQLIVAMDDVETMFFGIAQIEDL